MAKVLFRELDAHGIHDPLERGPPSRKPQLQRARADPDLRRHGGQVEAARRQQGPDRQFDPHLVAGGLPRGLQPQGRGHGPVGPLVVIPHRLQGRRPVQQQGIPVLIEQHHVAEHLPVGGQVRGRGMAELDRGRPPVWPEARPEFQAEAGKAQLHALAGRDGPRDPQVVAQGDVGILVVQAHDRHAGEIAHVAADIAQRLPHRACAAGQHPDRPENLQALATGQPQAEILRAAVHGGQLEIGRKRRTVDGHVGIGKGLGGNPGGTGHTIRCAAQLGDQIVTPAQRYALYHTADHVPPSFAQNVMHIAQIVKLICKCMS